MPVIPPDRLPPGQPPPPILGMSLNVLLADLLEFLWYNASAREQGALREMLMPLQEWAKGKYEPESSYQFFRE